MPHFRLRTALSSACGAAARSRALSSALMLLLGLMLVGGCRLCTDCDLDSYGAYGGAWQRTVRDSGRVGSIFDPGGSRASDLSARADSSAIEAKNRSMLGSGVPAADEQDAPETATPPTGEQPEPAIGEPANGESPGQDLDLQEMRERFRELDLQDINFRGPVMDAEEWQ